jgi:uncharacterized protein YkwD
MLQHLQSSSFLNSKQTHLVSSKQKTILLVVLVCSFSGMGTLISNAKEANAPLFVKNTFIPKKVSAGFVPQATLSAQVNRLDSQIKQVSIGTQYNQSSAIQNNDNKNNKEWGVAKQIDEHTWTVQVGTDKQMAVPQGILTALNTYRQKHGRGGLAWDNTLAQYAQLRANLFNSSGKLDGHAGFKDYLDNHDGFKKLGFANVGENSSLGYTLESVHLIEWVYAADKPHNDNQLNSKWSFVGIGVSGSATNLIFGGERF